MPRKRSDFGAAGDAKLVAMMNTGSTAQAIAAALTADGIKGASRSTVDSRVRELRGNVASPRGRPAATPPRPPAEAVPSPPSSGTAVLDDPELPATPEDIPENASLELLDKLLRKANTALEQAEEAKNLPLVGTLLRVAAFLAEARRKATPAPKADPNEQPDYVKLGATLAERMHRMVDLVCAEGRQG